MPVLWSHSPTQCKQQEKQSWIGPVLSALTCPHLGQMLWSLRSFSILFILRLFFGMGLSYMPFFSRCSLLWWIWAPCWSWKEQSAFRGLSRTSWISSFRSRIDRATAAHSRVDRQMLEGCVRITYWLDKVLLSCTCLGRWKRLFLRNMFLAWLQVPSMMMTLCFAVPTSWYCTNSSRFSDLGPGYRISVLLSRHTAASSGCFSSLNLLPTMTLHFPCGRQAASRGTVRSTRLSSAGCCTTYRHVETSRGCGGRKGHRHTFWGRLHGRKVEDVRLCFPSYFPAYSPHLCVFQLVLSFL